MMAKKQIGVIMFRGQFVTDIKGCAVFSQRDMDINKVKFFGNVDDATEWAIKSGVSERYLKEMEYCTIINWKDK